MALKTQNTAPRYFDFKILLEFICTDSIEISQQFMLLYFLNLFHVVFRETFDFDLTVYMF